MRGWVCRSHAWPPTSTGRAATSRGPICAPATWCSSTTSGTSACTSAAGASSMPRTPAPWSRSHRSRAGTRRCTSAPPALADLPHQLSSDLAVDRVGRLCHHLPPLGRGVGVLLAPVEQQPQVEQHLGGIAGLRRERPEHGKRSGGIGLVVADHRHRHARRDAGGIHPARPLRRGQRRAAVAGPPLGGCPPPPSGAILGGPPPPPPPPAPGALGRARRGGGGPAGPPPGR